MEGVWGCLRQIWNTNLIHLPPMNNSAAPFNRLHTQAVRQKQKNKSHFGSMTEQRKKRASKMLKAMENVNPESYLIVLYNLIRREPICMLHARMEQAGDCLYNTVNEVYRPCQSRQPR